MVQTYTDEKNTVDKEVIPMGPAASQIAIKQLGTNGGVFFGVNSAHPFENPTPLSNLVEMISILLIPASLCFTFGRNVKDSKQGRAIFIAMMIVLVAAFAVVAVREQNGTPQLANNHQVDLASINQPGLRPEVHPGRIRFIHRRAEADIRLAARQLLGEHRRTLLVELDIDVRVALMELAQDQRQERVAERVQEGEMHDACTAVVEFDLLFRQRELADHAVDVEQKFLPGLRQIRGAAMAFKQGDAELLLQFLDGARKSRLRDGHLFGCLREVTALGHRLEVLQLCQFHFVPRFLHIVHNYFRL